MAYVPNSGSVVAFQGTVPYSVIGTTIGSVISIQQGSVAAVIIGGSIAANFTPPANQSVSGNVGIVGNPSISGTVLVNNGSVVAFQGGAPWANTNVGSVITVNQGSVATVIIGGSIAASFTPPANQSVSGTVHVDNLSSVVAFQQAGSVMAVSGSFAPAANQSVSGTVGASIIGTVPVTQSTTPWLIGSVYGNISGSIAGTYANSTVASTVTGVAMMFKQNVSSSIMTEVSPTFPLPVSLTQSINQSVSGTIGASIVGQLPAGTAMIGSVTAYQGAVPWAMAGSVVAFQGGTNITSLVSTVPSSVQVGASIFGQLPAGTAMLGSITAYQGAVPWAIAGSVVATQGTSPWVVNFQNPSILAVPVGSVITVFQAPSIVGTYAEDAASASGDKGLLVMGARNDTLASVTSNDGDYSSHVVGPAGELIAANAPFTKWVQGTTSVLNQFGTSMITIAAQGASIFTYITSGQVANMSGSSVLVTFSGATSSVIGYTIAPSGGGSNMVIPNAWKSNANGAVTASVSGASSVYISLQGFISKT